MTTVYFTYNEYIETIRKADDDGWDNGDSRRVLDSFGVQLTNPGYPFESFEYPINEYDYYHVKKEFVDSPESTIEPGDTLYVVIVRYSTGSTFGYEEGQICFPLATKEQWKAEAVAADCGNLVTGHKPWYGYFETLETIDVHEFVVGK